MLRSIVTAETPIEDLMFYVAYRWLVYEYPIFRPISMPKVNRPTGGVVPTGGLVFQITNDFFP